MGTLSERTESLNRTPSSPETVGQQVCQLFGMHFAICGNKGGPIFIPLPKKHLYATAPESRPNGILDERPRFFNEINRL